MTLSNIQKIIQREKNDKTRTLYGAGNYCMSGKTLQAIASIVQHHVQFHSGIPGRLLKKSLNYIIAQICQSWYQNAKKIAADQ